MAEGAIPPLETWRCFGCSPGHDGGLRLTFTVPGPDRVRTEFVASEDHSGMGSILHGGIVAVVFDEVMMWCLLRYRRRFHVTVSMEQRLRRPVRVGIPLVAEAELDDDLEADRVRLIARMWAAADPEATLAEGSGVFVPLPERMLSLIPDDQRQEMEAILTGFASQDLTR